jgi:hypothetical protein
MTLSPKAQELLRKWGLDPSDPVTADAFAKLPPQARKLLGKLPFGKRRKKDKAKVFTDPFVVHGKKNPEGGIRRWREAEYAEVAIKTIYPKGVPDNISDGVLTDDINAWLSQNTNWRVKKHGVTKRGEVSRWTVRRVRKLPRG